MIKPYMLVRVREPSYTYIGEALSFPVQMTSGAEPLVMVRRVPGHPGTLDEIPLSRLEPVPEGEASGYRFVHYARIDGKLSFPVDMLRYDSCAPLNFRLVEREDDPRVHVERMLKEFGLDGLFVAKISARPDPSFPTVWTPERWESFSWSIAHHVTLRYPGEM